MDIRNLYICTFIEVLFIKSNFTKMDIAKKKLVLFCIKNEIKNMIMQTIDGEIWNFNIIELNEKFVEFQLYRNGNMASNEIIKL